MSVFQVGSHRVSTSLLRTRWSVTVDRKPVPGWFGTEAEAWAAGVQEADRVDGGPGQDARVTLQERKPLRS